MSIGLAGCGSSDAVSNENSNGRTSSRTTSNQNAANMPSVNTPVVAANGQTPEAVTPANRMQKRIDDLRSKSSSNGKTANPGPNVRPAAEDSVITTQLTDVAREVRTWQKHPILLRVEKVYQGENSTIKVVLRDGRLFDKPGKSIPHLDQATAASILQMVGVASGPS
ncbi:MAG: hypothetical protein ACRD6X_08755, partial [Pyrinomonadaceae bacterium]